jgi:hypothetical protein
MKKEGNMKKLWFVSMMLVLAMVLPAAALENVALTGMATQSSTWNRYGNYCPAELAINGITDGNAFVYQTAHTYNDYSPFSWWQVDLRNSYVIDHIVIWNRSDHDGILENEQQYARLTNLKVSVISSDGTVVWDTIIPPATYPIVGGFPDPSTYPNPSWTLYLPLGVVGQTVKIQRLNQDYLWFAEVQVFGGPTADAIDGNFWVGLKNSDDQGTQFDLRAELYINDILVSQGETLCVTGITRNPLYAKEVTVPFDPISNGIYNLGDVLYLRVLTRIGTNPDGSKCSGHNNAVGLRLYYDSPTRPSGIGAEISPDPLKDYFLHSASFDDASPTGAIKYKDSSGVNYKNGNQWKEIGVWQMVLE